MCMKIDINLLKPGMVLEKDILGKSGKPIFEKNTELTEVQIEFIKKFLVKTVYAAPAGSFKRNAQDNDRAGNSSPNIPIIEELEETFFIQEFNYTISEYKKMFMSWINNLPIKMYDVRNLFIPLFEQVETESFNVIAKLVHGREENIFYYKSLAVSVMSVVLAQRLHYEKKDWLQLGLAALLSECGLAKYKPTVVQSEIDQRHPVMSYEMVKDETTLTKAAKFAILQHHERLDGSGYPLNLAAMRIHQYAQIIAVADVYYSLIIEGITQYESIETFLKVKQEQKLNQKIVETLLENLRDNI